MYLINFFPFDDELKTLRIFFGSQYNKISVVTDGAYTTLIVEILTENMRMLRIRQSNLLTTDNRMRCALSC
jgi:hypothetical protein